MLFLARLPAGRLEISVSSCSAWVGWGDLSPQVFHYLGPAHYSKNASSMREVGSSQRWVETQMPLKAIVTLSLSPTHHCPKHTTWLNSTSHISYRSWQKTGNKYHPFLKPGFQLSHWFYESHNILLVGSFSAEVSQHQCLLSLENKTCHWSTEGSVGQIGKKVDSPRM